MKKKYIKQKPIKKDKKKVKVIVKDVNNNIMHKFESQTEAAEYFKCSRQYINKIILKKIKMHIKRNVFFYRLKIKVK